MKHRTLSQIIEASKEHTESYWKMLKVFSEHDGKAVSVRLLPALRQCCVGYIRPGTKLLIDKRFGMTHLITHQYWWDEELQDGPQFSLLLSYQTKYVKVDAEFIREKNAWCLDAAEERNHMRTLALGNPALLSRFEDNLANAVKALTDLSITMEWIGFKAVGNEMRDRLFQTGVLKPDNDVPSWAKGWGVTKKPEYPAQ